MHASLDKPGSVMFDWKEFGANQVTWEVGGDVPVIGKWMVHFR